jgi:hypothetical protein
VLADFWHEQLPQLFLGIYLTVWVFSCLFVFVKQGLTTSVSKLELFLPQPLSAGITATVLQACSTTFGFN